jgi:hypothetical protein
LAAPTFQWQGATANSSTAGAAISFLYPASGVASGDIITLFVVNKATSGTSTAPPTIATPSGWTLVVTMPGGTGNAGIAVGQTRLTLWQKNADADGTENGTTLTNLITVPTGGDITYGALVGFRRATAGSTLLLATSTGNDTTTGTAYSATMAADVGVQTDDLLVAMDATPASTNNGVTSPAISQPGCTLGTVTLPVNNGTTAGLDIRESMWVAACTAGTSSGAATISATYGTTAQGDGPGAVLRIREQVTVAGATPTPIVVPPLAVMQASTW